MFAIAYFKRYLTNDLGILQGKSAPDLYVCLGNKIMAPPSLIKTPENCTRLLNLACGSTNTTLGMNPLALNVFR
jgi:hypothetical protein